MPEPKTRTIVRITANTAKRQMPVPTARLASSGFRAPILWPTRMVIPMERPVIIMVTVCISILPLLTPETSSVWANCPTTSRSTPPYRA